jgi:hypothetical protein
MEDEMPYNLAQPLDRLKAKDKTPRSSHVLDVWIAKAERDLHASGGRLGWLVASTVVAAVLQQALNASGEPAFLLKGGSLLQHKFRDPTRTTTERPYLEARAGGTLAR